eukprot:EG_transcript_10031
MMPLHTYLPDGPPPLPPPPATKQRPGSSWWPLFGRGPPLHHRAATPCPVHPSPAPVTRRSPVPPTPPVAGSSPPASSSSSSSSSGSSSSSSSSSGGGSSGAAGPAPLPSLSAPLPRVELPRDVPVKSPCPVTVGVLKETCPHERRVALTPQGARLLASAGVRVLVERGAGLASQYLDHAYARAGAAVVGRAEALGCDVLLTVQPAEGAAGPPQRVSLRGSGGASLSLVAARPALTEQLARLAGALAVQLAVTHYSLASRGMLPRRMVVLGATPLGLRAAEVGHSFGLKVVVLDRDAGRADAVQARKAHPVGPSDRGDLSGWRATLLSYCRSADVIVATCCPTGGPVDVAAIRRIRGPAVVVDPAGAFAATEPDRIAACGDVTLVGYRDLAGLDRDSASALCSAAMADFVLALVAGREPLSLPGAPLAGLGPRTRPPRPPLSPPPSAGLGPPGGVALCVGLGAVGLILNLPSGSLLLVGPPARLALAALAL